MRVLAVRVLTPLGAALCVLTAAPAQESKPTEIQPTVSREARERAANDAAYAREIAPCFEQLCKDFDGHWLVIAHGVVLPRKGDALSPAKRIEVADAAARRAFPNTAHRYVIRLDGASGDRRQILGMAWQPPVAGVPLLCRLPRAMIHPAGVQVWAGGRAVEIGGLGPKGGAQLRPQLGVPGVELGEELDDAAARTPMLVSNIYTGAVWLDHGRATQLGLHDWETPGETVLVPGYDPKATLKPRARCRTAWLQVRIPEIGRSFVVRAAVMPPT